jgi:hypothetical protein
MPDHLHLLMEGRNANSNFRSTMTLVRQRTAVAFHIHRRVTLWQHGYYERVLRADEQTKIVAGTSWRTRSERDSSRASRTIHSRFVGSRCSSVTTSRDAELKLGATVLPSEPPS